MYGFFGLVLQEYSYGNYVVFCISYSWFTIRFSYVTDGGIAPPFSFWNNCWIVLFDKIEVRRYIIC